MVDGYLPPKGVTHVDGELVVDDIKKNKPIAFIVSIAAGIGAIISMFLTIDERYAHAADLSNLKVEQQQVIRQNRFDLQQSTNTLRKQSLEDKVFEIELTPVEKRSPYDNARLEKYKRDLADITQSLRQQMK